MIFNYILNNRFEALLISCVLFIIIYGAYCKFTKKTGSWDVDFFQPDSVPIYNQNNDPIKICRRILEGAIGKNFPSASPKFMFNEQTGMNLHFDMYNEELRIACDFLPHHHFEYTPQIHRGGPYEFEKQQQKNKLKKEICSKLGIMYIEVPYKVPASEIKPFILSKLKSRNMAFMRPSHNRQRGQVPPS